ncbi:Bug family tripartite tricarboxylate transporter substrate binding protein [Variovorax sp. PvP013]|uniref:Bug family tripartite tricarboxylate transporter substrate binding protein n=1 Tax=Variovorax sp. PvP013 TaxID=3156435 RepID=UPI003D1C5D45
MHRLALALILAAATLHAPARAQPGYPDKPIRMIVPYAAGGAADITARIVGQKMAEGLGVPVVVDNRGGANGNIGTDAVAKAAPDGYTVLLVASGPIVVNPSLYAKLPYDPLKDLAPVTQLTSYQYALVVPANSPITGVPELVAAAKADPGRISYGSTGVGGGGHLAGELFAGLTGTKLTHVPYKGASLALADLLGGQLSFTFDTVVTAAPRIASGKLRGYAVTGPRRAASLPQLPTMAELGYRDFNVTQFQGILVPAKTDAAIVERLRAEAVKALQAPDVIRRLATEGGYDLIGGTPAEFRRLIQAETASYGRLIKASHIQVD